MVKKYVVMSPITCPNVKHIIAERMDCYDESRVHHIGNGPNNGLIIYAEDPKDEMTYSGTDIQLECCCSLIDMKTNENFAEKRRLSFYFENDVSMSQWLDFSSQFYDELIEKDSLPKFYVGFIKKMLKLMQKAKYSCFRRIDLSLISISMDEYKQFIRSITDQSDNLVSMKMSPDQIRNFIKTKFEEAYPSILSTEDIIRYLGKSHETSIGEYLDEFTNNGIIQCVDVDGKKIGYRRKIELRNHRVMELDSEIADKALHKELPSVAIITNLLCEKIAVDAMIENKVTYMRYKTEGESHVYTIGWIGKNKVISTKLPVVGRQLKARISTGNITTRLLGAFQSVEHVLLVGVCGGVQRIHDFDRHSRLGDIVVSSNTKCPLRLKLDELESTNDDSTTATYVYCDATQQTELDKEQPTFNVDVYEAKDSRLLRCAEKASEMYVEQTSAVENEASLCCKWQELIKQSIDSFSKEPVDVSFTRPMEDKNKVPFKGVNVSQPQPPQEHRKYFTADAPMVRFGCLGAGKPATENDSVRDSYADSYSLLACDAEFDQVLQSVRGNGLQSFLLIRGVADYAEGRQGLSEWQSYSALAAASFMKLTLMQLQLPSA